jgi:hypothetical protein
MTIVFLNSLIIYMAIGVGIANICLLSGLLYIYRESYKLYKSKFTTGLLYFSLILLIQNILLVLALVVFYLLGKEITQPDGTEHYTILLLVNSAQLIAFSILFKITWE